MSDTKEPVKIGHASWDSPPRPEQVLVADYNPATFGASLIIRAKKAKVAKLIGKLAEDACNNDKIGYSQTTRITMYQEAKKVNFDMKRIDVECEADCASFAWCCAVGAANLCNIKMDHTSWAPCTSNMRDYFKPYHDHFLFLDADKYLNSSEYLQCGDIVVDEDRHAGVIVSGTASSDVIRFDINIFNIDTTSAQGSLKVFERTGDTEDEIEELEWYSDYVWYYELEQLSSKTNTIIGPRQLSIYDLKNFKISGLIPNNTYRFRIFTADSDSSKKSERTYSQGFIFSTRQDYPQAPSNVNFKLAKINDSNLLNKVCTISFNSPSNWGNFAGQRPNRGYRLNIFINGELVAYDDKLFTSKQGKNSKTLTLKELIKKTELKYKDTIQIGIQAWIKDENNKLVFNEGDSICSKPIYLKFFLNEVDKIRIKVQNKYKRAMLLDPKEVK